MRLFFLAGLLCFSSLANAASLSVDFTQNPTAFIESNWDLFNPFGTGFIGEFYSSNATTGTDTVAIVDENTGELLDTLDLFFTSGGHDGTAAEELISGSVVTGIDSGTPPPGSITVDATGSAEDITSDILNLPASITIQVTGIPPDTATPEPTSLLLTGLGFVGLSLIRRHIE